MRVPTLILAVCASLSAQSAFLNSYTYTRDVTPSAAASVVTIQQPASGARNVQLVEAFVYCVNACEFTQERNGTAATSTAATANKNNPDEADTATATVWHTSNVGVGANTTGPIAISAGQSVTLDISDIQLRGNGTSKNYTIRTNIQSARVIIVLKWREFSL